MVRPTTDLEIALLQANRQRGSAFLAITLDGLEGLLEHARAAPDRMARAQAASAVRRLVELLDEARSVAAIELPEGPQLGPGGGL